MSLSLSESSPPSVPARASRPLVKKTAALLLGGVLAASLPACNRTSGAGAARDDLRLVPKETDAVFMLNLTQARKSKLWQKLMTIREQDPRAKQEYEAFIKKCNFDPLQQIDSIFLAVPRSAVDSREYAVIARGSFDPNNVVSCAKQSAAQSSSATPTEVDYNGTRIYGFGGDDRGAYLAILDPGKKVIVAGGKEWIRRVIDLKAGKSKDSAKDNDTLMALIKRTRTGDALFWAGEVPPKMVDKLRGNPALGSLSTLSRVSGSLDVDKGLALRADLDLATEVDATTVTNQANEQLTNLKRDPKLQLMGLSSFIETIKVEAKKQTFAIQVVMTDQQVEDLATRLSGLARSFGM